METVLMSKVVYLVIGILLLGYGVYISRQSDIGRPICITGFILVICGFLIKPEYVLATNIPIGIFLGLLGSTQAIVSKIMWKKFSWGVISILGLVLFLMAPF